MRVLAKSADVLGSVRIVSPAVSDSKTVYSYAALTAEDDRLRIEATNGDLAIEVVMAAEVHDAGEVLLPARVLIDLAGKLVADHVSVAVEEGSGWADINSGPLQAHFRCGDIATWPRHDMVGSNDCRLTPTEFAAVGRILFAASTDLSHPILTGVHFADGRAVATDRYRIVRTPVAAECPSATVPASVLREVTRRSHNGCLLRVDNSRAGLTSQAAAWTARLIEGDFPDTTSYFDPSNRKGLTFERQELLQATAATEVAREEGGVVHLRKHASGTWRIWARHRELGEIHQDVTGHGGFIHEIAFNGRFLREALEAIDVDAVTLEIASPALPVLIRTPDLEQVVLPRRPVSTTSGDAA